MLLKENVRGLVGRAFGAAGEVDAELALSYVLWPTPALLGSVAAVENVAA